MALPNELVVIILEYVAEVSHHIDPWLWRIRLVNTQVCAVADSLIWNTIYIQRRRELLFDNVPHVNRDSSSPALTKMLNKVLIAKLSRVLTSLVRRMLGAAWQEDCVKTDQVFTTCTDYSDPSFEFCVAVQRAVERYKPPLAFEIIHNVWAAYLFQNENPALIPLLRPRVRIHGPEIKKLLNALCSEFAGHVACFNGGYYSATITEKRMKDDRTFEILKRNARHTRKIVFDDSRINRAQFLSVAHHCSNLRHIVLRANRPGILSVLKIIMNRLNVASISLFCKKETPSFLAELSSVMRQFINPPALELSLNQIDYRTAMALPTLVHYDDWTETSIGWLNSFFELGHSLVVAKIRLVRPGDDKHLTLPVTLEELRLEITHGRSKTSNLTVAGSSVRTLTLVGNSVTSKLQLKFPRLASFSVTTNPGAEITASALQQYEFGRLKHMEFSGCKPQYIAEFMEYFKPTESVIFHEPLISGQHFVQYSITGRCDDNCPCSPILRKIIEAIPPHITLKYVSDAWTFTQVVHVFQPLTQIYMVCTSLSSLDEAYKWLEVWPGDRHQWHRKFKVKKRPPRIPTDANFVAMFASLSGPLDSYTFI